MAEDVTPVEAAIAADARISAKGKIGWLSLTVAAFFGLFYAYDLWEAISTMVELPGVYVLVGLEAAQIPWWLLIVNLLFPVVVFVAALFVGLRRNVLEKMLVYVVGLAVVAALSLSVIAMEAVLRATLYTVV